MRIIRHQANDGTIQHAALQPDGNARRIEGDIFGDFRVTDEVVTLGKLLAPLAPTAIFCIGLNYRKHAEESNAAIPQYPVLFMKSPGAVQNPGDDIVLPRHLASDEVDYECELAVVIGKACKNVAKANALDYVLGYTCANDVSARAVARPSTPLRRLAHVWCSRTRSLILTRCASRPSSTANPCRTGTPTT
jgi:2-keto-4-pentenoate hydratase/2-oxohepta-3-ene-1,7-dioic acid hydratase in catechol pathway